MPSPVARLETLARGALSEELARFDIDGAIGARRVDVARAVEDRLRAAVEAEPLGIEILSVGLNSVRPPQAIAATFNETVAAEQQRLEAIEAARADAQSTLTTAAGSPDDARRIADLIQGLGDDAEQEAGVVDTIRQTGGEAGGPAAQGSGQPLRRRIERPRPHRPRVGGWPRLTARPAGSSATACGSTPSARPSPGAARRYT